MKENIILYGRIPSKKNSMRTTKAGYKIPSADYMKWEKEQLTYLKLKAIKQVAAYPIQLEVLCVFGDKRVKDLDNILNSVFDLLKKSGIIIDDDYTHIAKASISYAGYEKGVFKNEIIINAYPGTDGRNT